MDNKVTIKFLFNMLISLLLDFASIGLMILFVRSPENSNNTFGEFYISYLLTVLPGIAFGLALRAIVTYDFKKYDSSSKGFVGSIALLIWSAMVAVLDVMFGSFGYRVSYIDYIVWISTFIVAAAISYAIRYFIKNNKNVNID